MGFYNSKEPEPRTPEQICQIQLKKLSEKIQNLTKDKTTLHEKLKTFLSTLPSKTDFDLPSKSTLLHFKNQFKIISEQLMQILLHTDAIQAPTEELKLQRKNIVRKIQNLHLDLDNIIKSLPVEEVVNPAVEDPIENENVPASESMMDVHLENREQCVECEEPRTQFDE